MDPAAAFEASDEELVASYQRTGRREALDALLARYVPRLRRMVFGMVLDQSDADDVTQQALLRAIRGLHQFNGRSRFSTWLYRVTTNTTYRFLQRKARSPRTTVADLSLQVGSRSEEPPQKALYAEMQEQIRAELARLSPSLRAAMVLVRLEGMSADEAAEIENCSPATIYWRVHEARKILNQRLAKYLSS